MVETFQYIYNQLKFVEDEHARVRAANGMMVTMDKVLPFNSPEYDEPAPEFQTADKIGKEPEPKPTEPTTGKGEAPSKVAWTEEGLMGPAYDPVTQTWKYCPHCKRTDITHISGEKSRRPGSEYQACFGCRVYLNIDGKEKPMGAARGARR